MNDVAKNLKTLREAQGMNRAELAREAGLNHTAVRDIESGRIKHPRLNTLSAIAHVLGCTVADMTGESGVPNLSVGRSIRDGIEISGEAYATIPQFDLAVSAGPGALVSEEGEQAPIGYQVIKLSEAEKFARNSVGSLRGVIARGDSMDPTLHDGDQLLVDTSVQRVIKEGIYVIMLGEGLHVKRLSIHPTRQEISISSDNSFYESYTITPDEAEDLRICGLVVWAARRLG